MKYFSLIFTSFCTVLFFYACSGSNNTENQTNKINIANPDELSLGFGNSNDADILSYQFPSPLNLLSVISENHLDFKPELFHNITEKDKYEQHKKINLLIGVYIADFGYVSLFKRHNYTTGFFSSVYCLAEKTGLNAAFSDDLLNRTKKNIFDIDSIQELSNLAYYQIVNYLTETNQNETLALIGIGSYIESVYIATHLIDKYDAENIIIKRIGDQKYSIDNLVGFAKEFKENKDVKKYYELLLGLKDIYDELKIEIDKKSSVQKNEDGSLTLKKRQKISMTEDQFDRLKTKALEARSEIIKTN